MQYTPKYFLENNCWKYEHYSSTQWKGKNILLDIHQWIDLERDDDAEDALTQVNNLEVIDLEDIAL